MRQILHIFRKDLRHFWPEILLSLFITAAYAWVYPYQWQQAELASSVGIHLDLHHLQLLANTITALLPVSWLVLMARVIHDENLIGARQFWLTRPYDWRKLLSAKLLFVAVFLFGPYLIAQCVLLHRAGFPAANYFPNLLYECLLLLGAVVLPLFALGPSSPVSCASSEFCLAFPL